MKEYYYVEGSERKGPFSLEQLQNTNISAETLVWTKGMSEWKRADSIDEINEVLQEIPPLPTPPEERAKSYQNSTSNSSNNYSAYTEYMRTHVKPNSYLIWGILATIFCCLPLGIVSIVYASKVEGAYLSQQYDASLQYSRLAKKWSIAAMISGVVFIILYVILMFTTNFLYSDNYNSYFYNQVYL